MRLLLALLPIAAAVDQQAVSFSNGVAGIHAAISEMEGNEHKDTRRALEALMKEAEMSDRMSPEQTNVFTNINNILDDVLVNLLNTAGTANDLLGEIVDVVAGCNAKAVHNQTFVDAYTNADDAHTTCRVDESVAFTTMTTECGDLTNYLDNLAPGECSLLTIDVDSIDAWGNLLNRVNDYFHDEEVQYQGFRDLCTGATSAHSDKRDECDAAQENFEAKFCEYQASAKAGCDAQDLCYGNAEGVHTGRETTELPLGAHRLRVVILIKHIQCLVGRLIAGSLGINESPYDNCPLLDEHDTLVADYRVDSVTVPSKDVCDLIPGSPLNDAASFRATHYEPMPSNTVVFNSVPAC